MSRTRHSGWLGLCMLLSAFWMLQAAAAPYLAASGPSSIRFKQPVAAAKFELPPLDGNSQLALTNRANVQTNAVPVPVKPPPPPPDPVPPEDVEEAEEDDAEGKKRNSGSRPGLETQRDESVQNHQQLMRFFRPVPKPGQGAVGISGAVQVAPVSPRNPNSSTATFRSN